VCLASLYRLVEESECSDLALLNPLELEVRFDTAMDGLLSFSRPLNNLNLSRTEVLDCGLEGAAAAAVELGVLKEVRLPCRETRDLSKKQSVHVCVRSPPYGPGNKVSTICCAQC